VTPILRRLGHEVFTPTLTGVGERIHLAHPDVDLETHITDVVNVIRYEDLDGIVLVGWSYGGMVISGVLDRVPERLMRVIYLDAEVPRDGESLFDVAGMDFRIEMEQSASRSGDGWRTSLGTAEEIEAFLGGWIPNVDARQWFVRKLAATPQPIKTFSQPIRLGNPVADSVPRTFIRCPIDGSVWAHIYDPIVERLRRDKRWQIRELASNHCAPIAAPQLVAEALLSSSGVTVSA
jgi:pimeloyl-ACP methyl ester carboxylesterase